MAVSTQVDTVSATVVSGGRRCYHNTAILCCFAALVSLLATVVAAVRSPAFRLSSWLFVGHALCNVLSSCLLIGARLCPALSLPLLRAAFVLAVVNVSLLLLNIHLDATG